MKKILLLTFCLVFMCVTVVSAQPTKTIKVLYNTKELLPKSGEEAKILNNRVYVPVYLLREAGFSVNYKNSVLSLFDQKEKYISNLNILNRFNSTFIANFTKMDQEAFNILGKIILEEKIDSNSLKELLQTSQIDSKSFDYKSYTNVTDSSYVFLDATTSVDEYSKAIDALLKYAETGDKEHLKEFYSQRTKAIQLLNNIKIEFDQIFKLSMLKSLS
ncbi:hypothetical protein [Paenibacillus sp. NPDC093718]|uniref:hypothetical protein n=1 Tax=Paenibacillus sp. NPDC093718 TaxID=3390601 RepID=UPI003D01B29F